MLSELRPRRRTSRKFLLLTAAWTPLLLLAACAGRPLAPPERLDVTLRPARFAGAERPAEAYLLAGSDPPTTPVTSLAEAQQAAVLHNPALRAEFARFEAMLLQVPQEESLPDPRLNYTQFVEEVQTRVGEQEAIVGLSQTFPWFGKLRLRGDLAESKANEVLEDYRVRLLDLRRDVAKAWHRLIYEREAFVLGREDQATLEQAQTAAAALYGSGQRGRQALLRAQTELARVQNELTAYPARIAALEAELTKLAGRTPVPSEDGQSAFAPLVARLPEAGSLLELAFDRRPEAARLKRRLEQAGIQRELALRDYYPDLMLGANYIAVGDRPDDPMVPPPDEGDDAWNVTVGINIPLPNARRRAATFQAEKRAGEVRERLDGFVLDLSEEIRSVLPKLKALAEQREVLRSSLIPLAQETFDANRAAYESGDATFLDLLDAQRTLINVRRDLLRTERDLYLAWADLEHAVGGPIEDFEEE